MWSVIRPASKNTYISHNRPTGKHILYTKNYIIKVFLCLLVGPQPRQFACIELKVYVQSSWLTGMVRRLRFKNKSSPGGRGW